MSEEELVVLVCSDREERSAPVALLCKHSGFFRVLLDESGGFPDSGTRRVEVEAPACVLDIILHTMEEDAPSLTEQSAKELGQAYALAKMWDMVCVLRGIMHQVTPPRWEWRKVWPSKEALVAFCRATRDLEVLETVFLATCGRAPRWTPPFVQCCWEMGGDWEYVLHQAELECWCVMSPVEFFHSFRRYMEHPLLREKYNDLARFTREL